MHEDIQVPAIAPAAPAACSVNSPAALAYQAVRSQVRVINGQLSDQRSIRNHITDELTNDETKGLDRVGLEGRLKTVDARLADLDKALATAQSLEVTTAGQPCATYEPQYRPDHHLQADEVAGVSAAIFTALAFPLIVAYSRRIWRRSAKVTVVLPPEVAARMQAMEEAIESVAVEVERIGEGQRFMTQALAESPRGIGAGAAQPVMARPRESVPAERPLGEWSASERPL